jgi:hypothetical protein
MVLKLTEDSEFIAEEFHNDGIAERTFTRTQVQKWRIQTHPVESQKILMI